ncbi:SDR family NAD(P)-dependent oxidoreductase [Deinococcus psychrotolerans]|uniref:SDR family NAD(P)-dependent oxidoreductase n=1 Tax=Deinococcus psychrotolerans TaxID=2489213 RepID=A0A3G8YR51_9DEIO|nr:SDR family NAD(P)-dependent oxidoreductase [Deinococcus psychrotolerans]AZI44201.1 SDR family NAD(P)-dependent oxidoreductase [Deinococcus psychrotolerans]
MRLSSKVAVITGGGSGIGKATALKFAREGARIVVFELNEEHGRLVVDEIISQGQEAMFIRTDVSVFEDVQAAVTLAAETYGRLDIMFNNAGIGINKPLLDHEPADFDRVVKVNQYGVFYGILAAGRKLNLRPERF